MTEQPTKSIAAIVRKLRATAAADPDMYDTTDIVMWLVEETPERTWTPSELGRAVGIDATEARRRLNRLVDMGYVHTDSRGARSRYSAPRR